MSEHIVSRYDEELNDVARRIAEMGGMAERLVDVAVGSLMRIDADTARKVFRLIDALEDSDDVQNVFSNFDLTPEVQAELESAESE